MLDWLAGSVAEIGHAESQVWVGAIVATHPGTRLQSPRL